MRVLGIDLGIASCGWAVLEVETESPRIIAAGVRCFDAPLVDKPAKDSTTGLLTRRPKSADRRTARGQRRVIRRRAQRMRELRNVLTAHEVLSAQSRDALRDAMMKVHQAAGKAELTPWDLRKQALDRALTNDEFAAALGHIARHRGFRSNSKRDAGANSPDETSKMKKAMEQTREGLAKYRSFGEMLQSDPKFADRKRNREKDYSHTATRSDLEDELRKIFSAQRKFGNLLATDDLEAEIAHVTFWQRPLQDSEQMVGNCPFEPDEKRTAKCAPSFELFRFLQRLAHLQLSVGRSEFRLSAEQIGLAAREFGKTKGFTFKALRNALDLDPNTRFVGMSREKESQDIAARKGAASLGTFALHEALGDAPWNSLRNTPEKIDRIAEVLVFREDIERIREGLREIGLDPPVLDKLMEATEAGAFDDFRGAAHISAKAARNIVPGLLEGLVYSEACARVGYDHSTRAAVALKDINGPVTRRAFGEAIKQIRTVAREHGPIDTVHIELARDVGKSAEERAELTKGIEDRNVEKEKRKTRAGELIGRRINDIELLRYEFVEEQHYKCIYCDGAIAPDGFVDNDTRYQVDHILPWSRFGDDSFTNKTLCCTRCNQEKRGRTPFEWFSAEKTDDDWERFVACFESLKEMKGFKKRNFKLKDAAAVEEKFKARNLTDTRWAARLLADELKRMFPAPEGKRRIFTRPGAITSKLRRAWGFEGMKKIDGKRVSDDRHHAVDAIVLALTTESLLNRMTVEIQRRETEGRQDDIFHVQPPWDHFHREVVEKVYGENGLGGVFVSRAERRRARGKAHDATVKQIREIDGNEVVFERKAIEKLSLNDLDKIPVPQPYGSIKDPAKLRDELVAALRSWIGEGKPKGQERLPRSPKGDIIRKVRAATNAKVGLRLNGGTVDRGEMARVDVFRKADKNGKYQYFLVPIYPHEIATMVEPPTRAAKAGEEENWPIIDSSFEFLWSLNQRCWLGLTKISGEIIEGYFAGLDRATASITVFADNDPSKITRSIGVKTLTSFDKYAVDRLGRRTPIASEVRTWHGVACT